MSDKPEVLHGRLAPCAPARAPPPADPIDGAPLAGATIAALYHSERARLISAARRRIGNSDDAADLVQDAFARLLQVRPARTLHAPAAYLQRILTNLLRDRAKLGDQRFVDRSVPAEAVAPAVPPEQEWRLEAADLMKRYRTAVDALPPRTREVFLLHRVDELRYRDIAERLGITVAAVEYHMTRALAHLDRTLEP